MGKLQGAEQAGKGEWCWSGHLISLQRKNRGASRGFGEVEMLVGCAFKKQKWAGCCVWRAE